MAHYKKSQHYLRYVAGQKDGQSNSILRLDGLHPFEKNESGEIKVAPGEVFCRFMHSNGVMCPVNTKFSSESNLKLHVRRHRVAIEKPHLGAKKYRDHIRTRKFYEDLMAHVDGNGHIETSTPSKIETNSRSAPETAELAAHSVAESVEDSPLMPPGTSTEVSIKRSASASPTTSPIPATKRCATPKSADKETETASNDGSLAGTSAGNTRHAERRSSSSAQVRENNWRAIIDQFVGSLALTREESAGFVEAVEQWLIEHDLENELPR